MHLYHIFCTHSSADGHLSLYDLVINEQCCSKHGCSILRFLHTYPQGGTFGSFDLFGVVKLVGTQKAFTIRPLASHCISCSCILQEKPLVSIIQYSLEISRPGQKKKVFRVQKEYQQIKFSYAVLKFLLFFLGKDLTDTIFRNRRN